ncbi:ATP-binding protein [Clostridium sp. JNZ J1-5]
MRLRIFPRFRPFKRLRRKLNSIYIFAKDKVSRSIRIELLVTFAVCILFATITLAFSGDFISKFNRTAVVNYRDGIQEIERKSENLANEILDKKLSIKNKEQIDEVIGRYTDHSEDINKILITDLDGKILYKNKGAEENIIDIYSIIKNAMGNKENRDTSERKEHVSFYPLNFNDGRAYLVVKGIPRGSISYYYNGGSAGLLAFLLAVVVFILVFLFITRNKMKYIEEISSGLKEISQGNLKYRVAIRGQDELSSLAVNINNMARDLQNTIEEERKAEETKNQLITNVSHDLRTPLTSIMGYLGLIKEKKYESESQLNEYVNIAFNKSEKLKSLMEDLFEYTKVSNKVIKLNKKEVIMNELLGQIIEEFIPVVEENNLEMEQNIPKQKLVVSVDPDKTVRVFDNLLINAVKYSLKPGKIIVKLYEKEESVVISIHNKGKNIPKEELPYLFERFYRMDKSRTSDNGGSGLGLAISKNIVELEGGSIWAECEGEDISFFVSFPI